MSAKKRTAQGGSFKDYLQKQLADPEFRRAYEARMVVAELAMAVRWMREEEGLTFVSSKRSLPLVQIDGTRPADAA